MIQKGTCTPVFIAVLFIIAKTWKQPKCPLPEEWIKKMWYIYTMDNPNPYPNPNAYPNPNPYPKLSPNPNTNPNTNPNPNPKLPLTASASNRFPKH